MAIMYRCLGLILVCAPDVLVSSVWPSATWLAGSVDMFFSAISALLESDMRTSGMQDEARSREGVTVWVCWLEQGPS